MNKFFLGTALAAVMVAGTAQAAVPALTLNELTGQALANGPFTLGWTFDVVQTVRVTGLGAFDDSQDGLGQAHDVGIWDSAGNLIVSATVPNGVAGSLINQFRYVSAGAILNAGSGYRIGAVWLDGTDPLVFNGTGIATVPQIVFQGGNYIAGGALAFPSANGTFPSYFGPNFLLAAIPEPGTWLLMVAGFGLVGVASRSRKTVSA